MESPYYRTFIGLPVKVDKAFLDARRRLISRLGGERISWTRPEQYHVTIRFLGDTGIDSVRRISAALKADMEVPNARKVELSGLASFGPRKRPRVIWTGFEEKVFFGSLKEDLDHVLDSCGIPMEDQPFRAHLTLGRIRSLKDQGNFHGVLQEMQRDFAGTVLFDRMVFFRSILGPSGPEYQVLEELRF